MALSASVVWEVRSAQGSMSEAPSVNNGGGFDSSVATPGTDYSIAAGGYGYTDLATADGDDPAVGVTSASHNFVAADEGNIIHITAGTNWTPGFYTITDTAANAAILDRAPSSTNGALTGGTFHVGGALAAIGNIGSATAGLGAAPGNKIWVKADGAYSIGATDTMANAGTTTLPITIEGYKTARGDGYLGRNTASDGKLITTNFPDYVYTSTFRFTLAGGSFINVRNIKFTANASIAANALVNLSTNCLVTRCAILNPSINSAAFGVSLSTSAQATLFDCDLFMTGASGGATGAGIFVNGAFQRVVANRIEMTSSTSPGPAISLASTSCCVDNVIIGSAAGTFGIFTSSTSSYPLIYGNTIVGFVAGIGTVDNNAGLQFIVKNLITDTATYSVDLVDADECAFFAYNRTRDVIATRGNTRGLSDWAVGNVESNTGAAYSDYVDQSTGDYRLVVSSPATSAGIPAKASMGALQRDQASSGQKSYSC